MAAFDYALNFNFEPVVGDNTNQKVTQKGGDNKNYILQAKAFNIFMNKTFGSPTHSLNEQQCSNKTTMVNFLKGKTGIYTMITKDPSTANYTGHVDFIINGNTINGAHLDAPGGIKKIEIWQLD